MEMSKREIIFIVAGIMAIAIIVALIVIGTAVYFDAKDFIREDKIECQNEDQDSLSKELWEDYFNCFIAYNCGITPESCYQAGMNDQQIIASQALCTLGRNYEKYWNEFEGGN